MIISVKPWEGADCKRCGHFYKPGTSDGDYYANSKPCLYCGHPELGTVVRSSGCLGVVMLFLAVIAVSAL
jgi:hypothetical protein